MSVQVPCNQWLQRIHQGVIKLGCAPDANERQGRLAVGAKATLALIGVLCVFSSMADAETAGLAARSSVDVLGVAITRGMPESAVRAALPIIHCADKAPELDPDVTYCSVSDGDPSNVDGEVTFRDGVVHSVTRNWFVPQGAEPLEVLMLLHDHLARLAGEESAVCAKIETHSDQQPFFTVFALPEKVFSVQMHTTGKGEGALFRESLRVNPVPDAHKTRGSKLQAAEWCVHAN